VEPYCLCAFRGGFSRWPTVKAAHDGEGGFRQKLALPLDLPSRIEQHPKHPNAERHRIDGPLDESKTPHPVLFLPIYLEEVAAEQRRRPIERGFPKLRRERPLEAAQVQGHNLKRTRPPHQPSQVSLGNEVVPLDELLLTELAHTSTAPRSA